MAPTRDYTCPAYGGSAARLSGWLREAAQEGDAWLATQKPAGEWPGLLQRIGAAMGTRIAGDSSDAQYQKSERLIREIVAALGSFAHVGEIKPRADTTLYDRAGVLTKLDHQWGKLEETHVAQRALLQYAVALGTGYAWQTWDKHFYGEYKGDVRLAALSPSHVTFVQLPGDYDIQKAYVTLVREELPINLAKRIYARTNRAFADALVPDRDSPGWLQKGLRKVQQFLAPALQVRGTKPGDAEDTSFPTVDIFHAYILDGSLNETGRPMRMGAAQTNWSYEVPALGDALPTGLINPATQQPWTRPADPADALLFPFRRYCIFSRSIDMVAYDGPSPWWHGMTPVVRFAFNDWPWEALGRSCVGMIRPLEDSVNAMMQGIEDSVGGRLDPAMLYNDNLVSQAFADKLNPRRAGVRAAADLDAGNILKPALDATYYDVPQWITEWVKYLDSRMEYLTGAQDLTAIAKAKQLPSGDSIEKLLEMAGPLVQDMVRSVVMPLQQLGTMRIAYYLQFYTADRIFSDVDPESGDPKDWIYKPDMLIQRAEGETLDVVAARARRSIAAFRYAVTQSGVSEINRMTTKLFYLQLQKSGFPIDWWTIAKVAQLPRFGSDPEGTHTMIERYIAQLRMQAEIQQEFAQEGGGAQKGRPSSNQKPPHLVSKDGGTRSTVSTS